MRTIPIVILSGLLSSIAFAEPYTDFTGIWDGRCVTERDAKPARTIIIMDSDQAIQIDQATFKLPDVRKETTSYSCGDPLENRDTFCDEEHHYDYNWNASRTEITLSHEWNAPNGAPQYALYDHVHLRMAGTALEVVSQRKDGNGGSTEICTYPKHR